MSITYRCAECAETYEVDNDLAGKAIRCRQCDALNRVPSRPIARKFSSPPAISIPKQTPSLASREFPIMGANPPAIRLAWQSIPVWGPFLILLLFLLAGIGWAGWAAYDHFILQPQIAAEKMRQAQMLEEMRELYKEWHRAMRKSAYARSLIGVNPQEAENDVRISEDALHWLDMPGADTPEIRS